MPEDHPEPGSPFQTLGRLFPDETPQPLTILPATPVIDALRLMLENRYSQLPVVDDSGIRGVFSLWSLARYSAREAGPKISTLAVADVMENLPQVTVNTSIYDVLGALERQEAVLVVTQRGLQAVATTWDVLKYFVVVARPFVLLQEIELALRRVIELAVPADELSECIRNSVQRAYEARGQRAPSALEDFSFEDYKTLITARDYWDRFAPILSTNKAYVGTTLERFRELRNRVFHFRSGLTVIEYEDLAVGRDWLLDRLQHARGEPGGHADD